MKRHTKNNKHKTNKTVNKHQFFLSEVRRGLKFGAPVPTASRIPAPQIGPMASEKSHSIVVFASSFVFSFFFFFEFLTLVVFASAPGTGATRPPASIPNDDSALPATLCELLS